MVLAIATVALLLLACAPALGARTPPRGAAEVETVHTPSNTSYTVLNSRAVAASAERNASASAQMAAAVPLAFPKVPIYGFNCGPGHHSYKSAIDQLDWGCWDHDNCYTAEKGSYEWLGWPVEDWVYCDCDTALINRANAEARYGSTKKRAVAKAISYYFRFQKWSAGC